MNDYNESILYFNPFRDPNNTKLFDEKYKTYKEIINEKDTIINNKSYYSYKNYQFELSIQNGTFYFFKRKFRQTKIYCQLSYLLQVF